MAEKPILFNTNMVRAILEGRKTQTRRVMKPQPTGNKCLGVCNASTNKKCIGKIGFGDDSLIKDFARLPYRPNDILWVRETWYYEYHMHDRTAGEPDLQSGGYLHRYIYRASNPEYPVDIGVGEQGWRPSIHMPREAARLFLKVINVRAERLQDITASDVRKEGVIDTNRPAGALYDFIRLWNSTINKQDLDKYGWEANPWVFVYEFAKRENYVRP